jgi:Ca2+-binding RTX toxin-like protein
VKRILARALLVGCAALLVVGCAGVRSGTPQEQQGHTEATKNQAHSQRCEGTRGIVLLGGGYATNDVPGCPEGGLLLGTDGPNTDMNSPMQDYLYGGDGDDEVRGLGANDEIYGGLGGDVIYGGPGFDWIDGGAVRGRDMRRTSSTGATAPMICTEPTARMSSMAGMVTILLKPLAIKMASGRTSSIAVQARTNTSLAGLTMRRTVAR